jgi:hypothetical protein
MLQKWEQEEVKKSGLETITDLESNRKMSSRKIVDSLHTILNSVN